MTEIPAQYVQSPFAPKPRTLIDIFYETAVSYPDAPAIDDGAVQLTYSELITDIEDSVAWLAARGIGRGDRVGIRMPSGSYALYVAILATLAAGAAYVPVDADDPDERAALVFGEANVVGVITEQGLIRGAGDSRGWRAASPLGRDDAWIIFTSGSTGTPKGVAVTHRSAAAFVDAEAQMFLQDNPIGPGDRVLAGLSVAFDASCEEMWLAWRHGACLVPAPRSLVRSGMDLGPWLVSRDITVVSTVPTLAALWPAEALEAVRLLIFGGEACPPDLAERLAAGPDSAGREVWNTYGPTEATVVACAAKLDGTGPVSIGLPLPGWDLAVVGKDGMPVGVGEVGELVIGGVGLARYLDPEKDAQKYAPMPTLDWNRAYRSGDLVRLEPDGLIFCGRADDQVKVGGRRIELGEVDAALVNLPGVSGGAAAVRRTASGTPLLVGYIASADPAFDMATARTMLAETLPAALVPRLVLVDELPTRTSGKVDRDALPWPPAGESIEEARDLGGTMGWLAALWRDVLAAQVEGPEADFFALGGGSLSAAQLVAALRQRYPMVTVADLYDHPRLGSLAGFLDELDPPPKVETRAVRPTPLQAQAFQVVMSLPLATLTGLQWIVWLALINNVASTLSPAPWLVPLELVVAPRRVPVVRHTGRANEHRGSGRANADRFPDAGHLPSRRRRAHESLAGRAARAGQRCRESGRRTVDGVLRAGAGQQGRQGCRSALGSAGDRHAHPGSSQFDRAGGGSVRALGRRRPFPPRRHHYRQRRHHRRAHHAAAGGGHRKERRRRRGVGRRRPGEEGPVLEGLPRGEVGEGAASVAGSSPGPGAGVGGGLRVDVNAVGRLAPCRTCLRAGRHRLGYTRLRVTDRRDRARTGLDAGRDTGGARRLRGADRHRRAGAVAVAERGLSPGPQPGGLADMGDRTLDGCRAQLPVPAVRQPSHADMAARAGREGRPRHRDLHGPADTEVHHHRGQRIPGRRHHGGVL